MEQAAGRAGGPDKSFLATESIGRLMLKFSVPAVISMLVNAIYNIVDQIFIGWGIGELGMAATNVALPLTTISTALALLFGIGGASNFNLSMGRGKPEEAGKIAGNAIFWFSVCGLGAGCVFFFFLKPLLVAFGSTGPIMTYAEPYTRIIALGVPFMVFSTGASHMIRADGSPLYSMLCILSGAVFNLIFDPVFLFVFHMGIEGIALATTLGQMLSCGVAAAYLLRKFRTVPLKRGDLRPGAAVTGAIVAVGAASCFNQLAMTVVQIVKNNVLRHYGALSAYGSEVPLAAVGAISKVMIVFMAFIIGIAQGCQPISSFNYGAQNYRRVKETYKYAVVGATIVSVIAFLCYQLFPRQILAIFGTGSEVYYDFAIKYLRIFMMMTFLNGIQPMTSNFFTSIGKARMGFWMSLSRQIILLVPLLLILPVFYGMDGVMYAGPISDVLAAALSVVFITREFRLIGRLEAEQRSSAAMEPGSA